MRKQYNIRWRENDTRELRRVIKNFNAKVNRLHKHHPELGTLIPEKINFDNAVNEIKTRADFNRYVNKHSRFTRKGSEEVVTSSRGAIAIKWEVNEFSINQRAENLRRANTLKRIGEKQVTIGGKDTGAKRKEMGRIKQNEVKKSKKKFKNMSQKEWEKASRLFDRKMRSTYNNEKPTLIKPLM